MKDKWEKIILLVLLAILLFIADSRLGNGVTGTAIRCHAERYVQEKYPELELHAEEPYYNWKDGGFYEVGIVSDVSRDSYFDLVYSRWGQLKEDRYEMYVSSGSNTFSRLSESVTNLTEDVVTALEQREDLYVNFYLASDWSSVYDNVIDYPFDPEEEIVISELEVDGAYQAMALSEQYGIADIRCTVTEVSVEEMCRILLDLQAALEDAGVKIATVNLHIFNEADDSMQIAGFPYEHIGKENLPKLVEQAAAAWEEFETEYERILAENNQK